MGARVKWLHVRLTEDEETVINEAFKKTTQRKLSDYARAILLGKPMIGRVRNQSLQEILEVLLLLRKDLNGIGNNYNQAVHKLHICDHDPQIKAWAVIYENDRKTLLKNIATIRLYIDQTAEKWLQS